MSILEKSWIVGLGYGQLIAIYKPNECMSAVTAYRASTRLYVVKREYFIQYLWDVLHVRMHAVQFCP